MTTTETKPPKIKRPPPERNETASRGEKEKEPGEEGEFQKGVRNTNQ